MKNIILVKAVKSCVVIDETVKMSKSKVALSMICAVVVKIHLYLLYKRHHTNVDSISQHFILGACLTKTIFTVHKIMILDSLISLIYIIKLHAYLRVKLRINFNYILINFLDYRGVYQSEKSSEIKEITYL